MTERRTITGTMTAGDAIARATSVAEALRATGKTVTVGDEYEDVTVKRYGLRSVDILIEEAPPPAPELELVTETVADAPVVLSSDMEVQTTETVAYVAPTSEPTEEETESPNHVTEEEPEFVPDEDDPDSPAA